MQRSLSRPRLQPARSRHYSLSLSLLFSLCRSTSCWEEGPGSVLHAETQHPAVGILCHLQLRVYCRTPTHRHMVQGNYRHQGELSSQDFHPAGRRLLCSQSPDFSEYQSLQTLKYTLPTTASYQSSFHHNPSNYYILLPLRISILGLSVYFLLSFSKYIGWIYFTFGYIVITEFLSSLFLHQ